tara:strand:- start:142 stop:312 length:171 start_codon:yes stop_codon:yes gene_type:complete
MKHTIKLAISTFLGLYALLCNYVFLSGAMNQNSFAFVAVINVIAIAFGLATLFSKK